MTDFSAHGNLPDSRSARKLDFAEQERYQSDVKLRKFASKFKPLKLLSSEAADKLPYSSDPYLILDKNAIYVGQ